MTDRDRLIALLAVGNQKVVDAKPAFPKEAICVMADYLLANGVIVPPCNVGDTAYMVTINGSIKELTVEFININLHENEIRVYCNAVYDLDGTPCRITIVPNKVGEIYFYSREEAEQALKEREQV